jgi:hypothetical protein
LQSTAALFAALSIYGSLVDSVVRHVLFPLVEHHPLTHSGCRTYLVAGTPTSVLASHSILALLTADDGAPMDVIPGPLRPVLPSIARKIQESIGTEKPNIARPAREAKDLLRKLDDSLFGS